MATTRVEDAARDRRKQLQANGKQAGQSMTETDAQLTPDRERLLLGPRISLSRELM